MKTLFAYDCPGSTGSCVRYHEVAQQIIQSLPNDTVIVAWDSDQKTITRAELDKINKNRQSFNGTNPVEIVKACQQKAFGGHLVILTDGKVNNRDVDVADQAIKEAKMTFQQVSVHIVGSRPNISVSAPFTRECIFEVKHYQPGSDCSIEGNKVFAVTPEDLAVMDALSEIKTEEQFMIAYPSINAVVQAATIGTSGSPTMRDKILEVRKQIVKHKAMMATENMKESSASQPGEPKTSTFLEMISAGDFAAAEAEMRQMHVVYYGSGDSEPADFEGKLSSLVNMCQGGLRSKFDLGNIASQHVTRTGQATAALTEQLPNDSTEISDKDKCPLLTCPLLTCTLLTCPLLTCPITLGEGLDMVLMIKTFEKPLLSLLDMSAVNNVINNPLNAFMYDDFIEAIRKQVDHFVSLESYKLLLESSASNDEYDDEAQGLVSPLTRAPIAGAIAFGEHVDHAKATDWMLAKLFGGGKLLGNIDLWYAVVWMAIAGDEVDAGADEKKKHEGLPWLKDLLPLMEQHMRWRLAHRNTYAALSGLSQYLCTKVPLGAAVWYVLHSCLLNPSTTADPLRPNLFIVRKLERILQVGNYPIDPRVRPHITRLQVLMKMLSAVTKPARPGECIRLEHCRLLVSALFRNSMNIDCKAIPEKVRIIERPASLVLLDGHSTPESVKPVWKQFPTNFHNLSVPVLAGLFSMVHPNKSASDIPLPWNWCAPALANPWPIEWPIYSCPNAENLAKYRVPVCEATCRPFYNVKAPDDSIVTWKDEAERVYGPIDQLLPLMKYFGAYISKHKEYPTLEAFIAYVWNRAVAHGHRNKTCLPIKVRLMCEQTFADHAELMAKFDAAEFKKRWLASVTIVERQRIEAEANKGQP